MLQSMKGIDDGIEYQHQRTILITLKLPASRRIATAANVMKRPQENANVFEQLDSSNVGHHDFRGISERARFWWRTVSMAFRKYDATPVEAQLNPATVNHLSGQRNLPDRTVLGQDSWLLGLFGGHSDAEPILSRSEKRVPYSVPAQATRCCRQSRLAGTRNHPPNGQAFFQTVRPLSRLWLRLKGRRSTLLRK